MLGEDETIKSHILNEEKNSYIHIYIYIYYKLLIDTDLSWRTIVSVISKKFIRIPACSADKIMGTMSC